MNQAKEQLLWDKIDAFPVLPTTINNVLAVTSDPEASANDLLQAILPDQSMCVAILKIANSALFGQPKKVSSIERAIMVLGFNEVQSIVLGKAVVGSFAEIKSEHQESVNQFWEHSFMCALAAKTIAENVGLPAGDFFISGLIHDIGKLVMLLSFQEDYVPEEWIVAFSSREKSIDENMIFSVEHGAVGSRLLKKWNFPENLLAAIEHHHEPFKAAKRRGYPLIIQLADFYAHVCANPEMKGEQSLEEVTNLFLPDLKAQWATCKLPWQEVVMESWFAWLKIEYDHGSSVMNILASK